MPASAAAPGPAAAPGHGTASAPSLAGPDRAVAASIADARDGGTPGSRLPAWTAVVTADRAYFDSVVTEGGPDAAALEVPAYCPERRFRPAGREMRIGRRSVSRGLEPEIDLTGPPADPGVSYLHAVLTAEPDGTWTAYRPSGQRPVTAA